MPKVQIIPTMLPNKGVVLDKPEEMLLKQFSPYSRNMEFYNELIQGRLGLTKFDLAQLSGKITNIDQYWKFTSSWWLMVCTTKDIYAYDFSNTRFDILTPVYNTGTIEVKTGELNKVYGSGSPAWDANLKEGDFIKIGAGSIHTGSTWYEVETVDSATLLTIKTNAPITAAGTAYVARQCFTGSDDQHWWSATFQDKNLGETWIATNGKDKPVRWTGANQVQALANLPTGFVSAKYVETYKNRLMFAWTVEVGNQPQRERWSAVADCEDWTDSDFHDFVDEDTWITGICNFNDYHIVMKEYEGYIGRPVGGAYTFDFEKSTTCIGCWSAESLVPRKDYIYYFGRDNEFHRWNLLRDESISKQILPETKDFDPVGLERIYGWDVAVKHQIRWHCPQVGETYNNYTVVYDYENEILQVWQYESAQACCAIGEYVNVLDLYVDDAVWGEYYIDEHEGYWDSRIFQAAAAIPIYGGYDGYVRNADIGTDDDGVTYYRRFRSTRQNFDIPDQYKRLWKREYWLESSVSGSIVAKMRKDDETTWGLTTKTISLVDATKDIIKKMVTWDKRGRSFQTQIDAANHFALLGWMDWIFMKRKKK